MSGITRRFALVLLLVATLGVSGCRAEYQPRNPQEVAIQSIRSILELPQDPLVFVENTTMANSPNGDLAVACFKDEAGRKYYVDLISNRVVEIDARSVLENIPDNAPASSEEEIWSKVDKILPQLFPGSVDQLDLLAFEVNGKVDNFFFDWRDMNRMGSSMPPFLQLAYHKSGILFAYYNTLNIGK